MATQVQRRRGTTAQHATFSGQLAELTVDTDKMTVVVQDGSTLGGHPLAKESTIIAHTTDAVDAHDASAISVLDTAAHFTATDVEGVLAELAASGGGTSGTYTPTATNILNIATTVVPYLTYTQVGTVVTFAGVISNVRVTSTSSGSSIRITLPVASGLTSYKQLSGTVTGVPTALLNQAVGTIYGDTVNDAAYIDFVYVGTDTIELYFSGQYQVL